nr:nucleoside-diphosphate kinase [Kibdelosporangium sp. MJ126-NF4]CEL18016.1 hypothetical protein [Kibdelosporangium sp. MJ126-NF4]CTQ90756.1 hypothetical protein [Kibdelosporangium sp. MJ126-NF4]
MTDMTAFWSTHLFALATPDALLRGLGPAFVQRLRVEGLTPVAARLTTTDSDMLDEMYADLIAGQWQTWRYRLIDDVFALGPTLALLCRYDGDLDDPHAHIAARKGHHHPHLAELGTMRKDFGSINSILSVMHASDSPREARHDATVYRLSEADVIADDRKAAAYVDYLAALTKPAVPEQRDFDAVLSDVRARLLLAVDHHITGSARDSLIAEFPTADLLARPDAGKRLADLVSGLVDADVHTVLQCEFDPPARESWRASDLFEILRRHGVDLDRWERIVLESSLYFPPVRREVTA